MIDADARFVQRARDEDAPELVLTLLRNIYLDLKAEARNSAAATLGQLARLAPPPDSWCDMPASSVRGPVRVRGARRRPGR